MPTTRKPRQSVSLTIEEAVAYQIFLRERIALLEPDEGKYESDEANARMSAWLARMKATLAKLTRFINGK